YVATVFSVIELSHPTDSNCNNQIGYASSRTHGTGEMEMNIPVKREELGTRSPENLAQVKKSISKFDKSVGPSGAPRRRYRTIWISDVHLGTRGCNDRMLIDFLDHVDSETLYLVGDIIDGWRMKKRYYWPERHNAIVRRIMKRAKRGTEVIYIPGNHD